MTPAQSDGSSAYGNEGQPTPTDPVKRNAVYHGPEVLDLSRVAPSRVHWLWPDRIALGKLTLLAGDPGLGKSYLTLDLAARVSSGRPLPGEVARHGKAARKVVLLSAEDDPADTIRPRLDAAGADVKNVLLMAGVRTGHAVRHLSLGEDLAHLRTLVEQLDGQCRLIIIDPISAYLGDDEGHSNTKVRNLLAPLAKLAQRSGCAVLAVTHLNKGGSSTGGGGANAIYRTMGSLAFTAAARAVHLLARDPNDAEGARRLVLPVKNNLGNDRSGWGFTLTQAPRDESHPSGFISGGETRIAWDDGPTAETADALLNPPGQGLTRQARKAQPLAGHGHRPAQTDPPRRAGPREQSQRHRHRRRRQRGHPQTRPGRPRRADPSRGLRPRRQVPLVPPRTRSRRPRQRDGRYRGPRPPLTTPPPWVAHHAAGEPPWEGRGGQARRVGTAHPIEVMVGTTHPTRSPCSTTTPPVTEHGGGGGE